MIEYISFYITGHWLTDSLTTEALSCFAKTKNWCVVLVHKAFSSPPMAYKGTSSGWKNDLGAENTHQEIGKASSGG